MGKNTQNTVTKQDTGGIDRVANAVFRHGADSAAAARFIYTGLTAVGSFCLYSV